MSEGIRLSSKTLESNSIPNKNNLINILDIILIVDDSESLRKTVIRLLQRDSYFNTYYEFKECSDGCDLLSKVVEDQVNGGRIKIIITDENMEFLNGSKAIAILKDFEFQNKIKRIFISSLTAFIDKDSIQTILDKGANLVLNKPLNNKQLETLKANYLAWK